MSDETKRHEKSAELIAASNAYYRRFANKVVELPDGEPTEDEKQLAEMLLTGLTAESGMEVARLLKKKSVRAHMLYHCLKKAYKV